MTPRNDFSSPIGSCTGTTARPNTARSDSSDRSRLARSRSSRFSTTMRGSSSSAAASQTFSVETSTRRRPRRRRRARRPRHAQRRARVAQEIRHAGRVDEVDLVLVPLDVGEAARQRVLARDLLFVVVGHRRPVVHAPESVHRAGIEQQRRDELCLAGAAMADEGDISDDWERRRPSYEQPSDAAADSCQLPAASFQLDRLRTSGRHAVATRPDSMRRTSSS